MKIRHATPGRLRIQIDQIRSHEDKGRRLLDWLRNQPALKQAEVRPVSGSVILYFTPGSMTTAGLLSLVHEGLQDIGRLAAKAAVPGERPGTPVHQESRTDGNTILSGLFWFIGATIVLAAALVSEFLLNIPVTLFSPVGAAALIGAVPLLAASIGEIRQKQGFTLLPFLAGTCLLALGVGEVLTALEVIWVTALSRLMEEFVTDRSKRAIREALQLSARKAFILRDGLEIEIPVEELVRGDIVVVHSSEMIPVDGIVTEGQALVDEASLTGRAEPEFKEEKSRVFAGTLVQQGVLFIRTEQVGEATYLGRVRRLVEAALVQRAPAETRADLLARRLVKFGGAATLATLVLTGNPIRALTVLLVAACPCATILAASTAVTAAIANGARNRCLIKGGLYLERLGEVDCFCFDKTGTLTEEVPQVLEVIDRSPRQNEERILKLAVTAETHNTHPLARAVAREAAARGILPLPNAVAEYHLGRGVKAEAGGDVLYVGNQAFMKAQEIDVGSLRRKAEKWAETGGTALWVARGNKLQGLIVVGNDVRLGADRILKALRLEGVRRIVLVTGDLEPVTRALVEQLAIDDYRAALLPEDKATFIESLRRHGLKMAMVGDGINDAVALAKADVGIAMGAGGAEAAIEAADISLIDSDLESLLFLRRLSRQTVRVIEQNHWLAVSTNMIGMGLGAGGLITPMLAGLLHIVHTLGIMVNSSRLLHWSPGGNPPD
jgi:heavy metal translocating P-type ATPase